MLNNLITIFNAMRHALYSQLNLFKNFSCYPNGLSYTLSGKSIIFRAKELKKKSNGEFSMLKPRYLVITGLIFLVAAARLLPHLPNFTPIMAIALFGGAYFSDKRMAFAVPFTAMFASDIILGFHSTMIFVYIGFALAVGLGMLLRNRVSILTVGAAALTGSILFFLITNFGVWLTGTMYPMTFQGLITSYTAGIPFFRYSMLGDLIYSGVLFGAFEYAQYKVPALQKVRA